MVDQWQLDQWKDEILKRWNDINLFQMTRGINRFKGLAMALGEIHEKYTPIEGIEALQSWSKAVNVSIVALPEEVKIPFVGAKEGLAQAHTFADVAVVSSANRDAVEEEWTNHKLLDHVDILLAQDCGSKAHCISEMLKFGYDPQKVLMVGDAPGDKDAADKNGVFYYPILVNREQESWENLPKEALARLEQGTYAGAYQEARNREFLENLGG